MVAIISWLNYIWNTSECLNWQQICFHMILRSLIQFSVSGKRCVLLVEQNILIFKSAPSHFRFLCPMCCFTFMFVLLYFVSWSLFTPINVRKYRRGNKKRETDNTGYTKTNEAKQKHNTICVRNHNTQANTNNVHKTWSLLQKTGVKEPYSTSFLCGNRNKHHNTELRT